MGDGADAGFGGELVVGGEALADVAEFGEDLGGADAPRAREGHDDLAVGELGDGVLDAAGELGDLGDEGSRTAARARTISPLASASASPARPRGAARRRASSSAGVRRPQIAVLGQEGGQALLAEALRRCRGRDSGSRKASAIGLSMSAKMAAAPGQKPSSRLRELVGEGDARGDQVVAAAHQGAQRLDLVGGGRERRKRWPSVRRMSASR